MSNYMPPQVVSLRQAAQHFEIDRNHFTAIVKSAGIELLPVPTDSRAKGLDEAGMRKAAKLVARYKAANMAESVSA